MFATYSKHRGQTGGLKMKIFKKLLNKLFPIEETFEQITERETGLLIFSLYRRLEVINQDHIPYKERNYFWILETEEIRKLIEKLETRNYISTKQEKEKRV